VRRALVLLIGLVLLPASAAAASPDRIIVQRAPGLSGAEHDALLRSAGADRVGAVALPRTEVVAADDPAAALARLRRDPDVVYAEPDRSMHVAGGTSFLRSQWALENMGDPGTVDADMDVPEAWATSTGAGVPVGVVDTGVLATHPGLAGQVAAAPRSRDFVGAGGADFGDANGHGTFVSGIVASRPHGGAGTAGVAPDATLVALRALGANGSGSDTDIAEAFAAAGDSGLRIVNASFNGPASTTVARAIEAHPGTLYVVAAGNGGSDDDAAPTYPCDAGLENVLCVGASDDDDQPWSLSNHGAASVDLYAPGVRIESTELGNVWGYDSGTSMAAANVSGEAALVLAAAPGLSTHELKLALMQSGDPLPALAPLSVTGRRANAASAVALARSGTIALDADEDGEPDADDPTPRGAAASVAPAPPAAAPAPPAPAPAARTSAPAPAPAPADPLPKLRSLRVAVARRTRRVTASARADRAATLALRIDRRRCTRGHCRWSAVAARTVTSAAGRASLSRRLAGGRYRVTATPRSRAGTGRAQRRGFRVR
jgi:thermitase